MNTAVAAIRKDYTLKALDERDVAETPFQQFAQWWDEAVKSEIEEVNAMTLATSTYDGKPSARIVLLKDFDDRGFVFFSNYRSLKGRQLELNPNAALVFFWKELERQVRIEGTVEKVDAAASDAYFFSRPEGSRLGAWASPQSQVIADRQVLDENKARYQQLFGTTIPRPVYWGGYRVIPASIEFWQGRNSRLHDRISYTRQHDETWKIERLAP